MDYLTSAPVPTSALAETANFVGFKTANGQELQATVLKLMPHSVTFEMYSPQVVLSLSEVLNDFRIYAGTRSIYRGKAVVNSFINSGAVTVCEVAFSGPMLDLDLFQLGTPEKVLPEGFKAFFNRWQKFYQIRPEYKLVVADLQNFLDELQLWVDHLELAVRGLPTGDRSAAEREIVRALPAMPAISAAFERFEAVARTVPDEVVSAHRAFCRRQLHPMLMSSPFMHRIYTKPLGYAGDYEMIDMIIRNDCEGSSIFGKLLNDFILDQAPARSVRNRVDYFLKSFEKEAMRVANQGRAAKIFSLGCGPAREVQRFLAENPISDNTQISLLDFNEETLNYTSRKLEDIKRRHNRRTPINLIRKSVHQLLKESAKPAPGLGKYDLIYCSGLYDYLNDRVCRTLNTYLYDQLMPGGLLIVTNFDPFNPIRSIQEHIFDWFLIYRDGQQLAALAPEQAAKDNSQVKAEYTGCNIFLETRKPG